MTKVDAQIRLSAYLKSHFILKRIFMMALPDLL